MFPIKSNVNGAFEIQAEFLVDKRRYQNLVSYQISKKISKSVKLPRPDTQFLFTPGFLDSGKQFI